MAPAAPNPPPTGSRATAPVPPSSLLVEGTPTFLPWGKNASLSAAPPLSARTANASPHSARLAKESENEKLRRMVEELKASNAALTEQLAAARIATADNAPNGNNASTDSLGWTDSQRAGSRELRAVATNRRRQRGAERHALAGAPAAASIQDADHEAAAESAAARAKKAKTPKTPEQLTRILATLKQRAPFDSLEESQQLQLIDAMTLREAKAGEVLVREGDEGHRCFVLQSGELSVKVGDKEEGRIRKDTLFGEIALLYSVPRTATIVSLTDAAFFELERTIFQSTLREENVSRRARARRPECTAPHVLTVWPVVRLRAGREAFTFLRECELFNSFRTRELSRVADVIETRSYREGEAIVREGEVANGMYFVREGQVVVKQKIPAEDRGPDAKDEGIISIIKPGGVSAHRRQHNSLEWRREQPTSLESRRPLGSTLASAACSRTSLARRPSRPSPRACACASTVTPSSSCSTRYTPSSHRACPPSHAAQGSARCGSALVSPPPLESRSGRTGTRRRWSRSIYSSRSARAASPAS